MRAWVANSYVLSVSILVAELVRQHQEDADVDSEQEEPPEQRTAISKSSLNALALFLVDELQHPMQQTDNDGNHAEAVRGMRFTTLASLLRRLQRHVADQSDFMILSSVLVGILSTIDSPDAMSNVVDRIAECVAPLSQAEDAGGDSTGSLLMRKSLLGLFVRKFLLAVNRLLFDGISRLYDDVVRYVEQFREEEGQVRDEELEAEGDRGDDSSSDALSGDSDEAEQGSMEMDIEASPQSRSSSGQSSEFLWKAAANDSLLLSPIPTRVSAVHSTVFTPIERSSSPSSAASPPPKVSSELSFPSVATGPHDSSMWSHDQMNYILSDMMRTIERDRSMNGNMRADDDPFNAQLRQVTETEKVNPSVLFVKYLDFLNRRDYQGALDSLHQYHDIALSTAKRFPQPGSTTAEAGGNTNGSASSASGSNGMHFQGTGIQYAALNLAGLQIVFDHYQAALGSRKSKFWVCSKAVSTKRKSFVLHRFKSWLR
ncbi:Anaphase-promoting complex subunit 5 [Globisporangium polare]